jgi:hypothetical protein
VKGILVSLHTNNITSFSQIFEEAPGKKEDLKNSLIHTALQHRRLTLTTVKDGDAPTDWIGSRYTSGRGTSLEVMMCSKSIVCDLVDMSRLSVSKIDEQLILPLKITIRKRASRCILCQGI